MFGIDLEMRAEIRRAAIEQAAAFAALATLLAEKGIITFEELEVAKIRSMAVIDQELAKRDAGSR